jgi:translation initiation factor IF-2
LGVNVIEGRLALNDKVRIMRDEKVVGESKIVSIKRSKQDVKDVARGNECGIILAQELDFRPHDMVLSYK